MSEELIKLLRENNITIVNDIMDKRNGSMCMGYHLRSPSTEKSFPYPLFNLRIYGMQ